MLKKYAILLAPNANDASGGQTPPPTQAPPATETKTAETKAEEAKPAEAQPVPPPAPMSGKDDPLLSKLFEDFSDGPVIKPVAETPPAPDQKAEEPPKAETPKPEEKAAGEPKKEEKPPRKKKASLLKELDAPIQPAAQAPQAAPAPAPKEEAAPHDPDADFVQGLNEEQKDELAEAEYAERLFGDKYKSRRKALIKFYRDLEDTAAKLLKDDPERKLDEEDAEWQKFLRSKPRIESVHIKQIQRTIGEEAAVARVKQQYEPKLTELERKQQEIEFKPKVEGVVEEFRTGIADLLAADEKSPVAEALKLAREKGAEEAAREFPLETRIHDEETARASDMTREYFMFAKKLRRFDQANPIHQALLQFINDQGKVFLAQGGNELVREGKTFMPRQEYMQLAQANPQEAQKHWTFNHRDIVEMLAYQTKINIENRIKAEESRAKALGFVRGPKPNSAGAPKPPAQEPKPINPPKATPKPSAGAATPASAGEKPQPGEGLNVVDVLRLRG